MTIKQTNEEIGGGEAYWLARYGFDGKLVEAPVNCFVSPESIQDSVLQAACGKCQGLVFAIGSGPDLDSYAKCLGCGEEILVQAG